jgi:hypothetical protein
MMSARTSPKFDQITMNKTMHTLKRIAINAGGDGAPGLNAVLHAGVAEFVALGQLNSKSSRYPKFRWMFPIFYSMATVGFFALFLYCLLGESCPM